MTNVTLHPPGAMPPADAAPAPAHPTTPKPTQAALDYITDDQGRRLGVRKIGPRERMRLFKAVGPANAKNEPYVGTATLAYAVAEIDGEAVPPPASDLQIEALVERLGDDGINAVARVMAHRMGITDEDIEAAEGDMAAAVQIAAARKQREALDAAKNSPAMPNS